MSIVDLYFWWCWITVSICAVMFVVKMYRRGFFRIMDKSWWKFKTGLETGLKRKQDEY